MVEAHRRRPEHGRSMGIGPPRSGRALGVGRVSPSREACSRDPPVALSRKPFLRRNSLDRGEGCRTFIAPASLGCGRQYRRRDRAAAFDRTVHRRDAGRVPPPHRISRRERRGPAAPIGSHRATGAHGGLARDHFLAPCPRMRPEAPPPGVLYDIVAVSMTVSETSTWRDQAGEGKSVESLRSDTAAERYRALLDRKSVV